MLFEFERLRGDAAGTINRLIHAAQASQPTMPLVLDCRGFAWPGQSWALFVALTRYYERQPPLIVYGLSGQIGQAASGMRKFVKVVDDLEAAMQFLERENVSGADHVAVGPAQEVDHA